MGVLGSLIKTVIKAVSKVVTKEIPKAAAKAAARGVARAGVKKTVKTAAKAASKKATNILRAEKLNKTAKDIKNAVKDVKNIIDTIKDPIGTLKNKITSGIKDITKETHKKEKPLSEEAKADIYEDLQEQFLRGYEDQEKSFTTVKTADKSKAEERARQRAGFSTENAERKVEEVFKTDEDIEREKQEYKDEDEEENVFVSWHNIPKDIRDAIHKDRSGSSKLIDELIENGFSGAHINNIREYTEGTDLTAL